MQLLAKYLVCNMNSTEGAQSGYQVNHDVLFNYYYQGRIHEVLEVQTLSRDAKKTQKYVDV